METSLFKYNVQNTLTLFILIALSIVIMTIDQRYHYLESVRSTLSHLLYPIRQIVGLPGEIYQWGDEFFTTREQLQKDNARLKQENFILKAELQRYTILQHENQRLRKLFNSAKRIKKNVLITEFLSVNLDPYKQQVMINKGSHDGVYIGQPLIDANGVMGQIIHTTSYSATALLISDPNHALPVRIDRSGLRTIAAGTGNPNQLKLLYIPDNSDIQVGDLVVTSGLGGRFPANYPVAKVSKIIHSQGKPFSQIFATPLAHLDQSSEALLVWNKDPVKPNKKNE